jgi:hypothetical protein
MPATPTAAHRGSSAAAAAAAAAHAVDDSYYAGSPDSATGDTGSASDREDGIEISGRRRQLSPHVGCAEDGMASLDRFRRCELLRGRWIPFDKTYLERLFDSALTEMNREILENERLTSMTSTACASSTASKTGRRQSSSSSRASRSVKSAVEFNDNKYVGSYNGKACSAYVFGRREATRTDVRNHQKAQKELRQTAAISPADIGASNQAALKSSKRKNAEIVHIDVEDDCTSESMGSSTAESSTSVQMSSERPSARHDSDLPIVGPANNQWVIIEKNALLRCFEEALASEVRQARAGRAVPNDSAAAQQRADKRRWKQHRPGGARTNGSTTSVKEPPPRPSSAPILLQSASPSFSSSDVESDEAVCRDKGPLMSKFGPLPTSAGGKYDASMSNVPSLNDYSQQQFTGRFPSVFPPPPSQQMPLPFQQLFASYPFPAPPPFAAAAAAAFSPEAAAAATAAFLNTMRHQLAAGTGGSGAGGALYHPDTLPFMLSSFLFQQAPLFAGARQRQ